MVCPVRGLDNRQCPKVRGLTLIVSAVVTVKLPEIDQSRHDVWMVRPGGRLLNCQRSLIDNRCFVVCALELVVFRQIVQRRHDVGMLRPVGSLHHRQRISEEWLGGAVPRVISIGSGQIITHGRHKGMASRKGHLGYSQRSLVQGLRLKELTLSAVKYRQVGEGGGQVGVVGSIE